MSKVLVRIFYPHVQTSRPIAIVVSTLFAQRILRRNGGVWWPVHPSSRVVHGENIVVGARSFSGLSMGCYIQGHNGIVIGDNLRMGPGVGIISANHNEDDYDRWQEGPPVRIGNNVWLGMNAVVLPGVEIGSNVIIGAGSVVTGNIPPDCVAAGNPCKVIRRKGPYEGVPYGNTVDAT